MFALRRRGSPPLMMILFIGTVIDTPEDEGDLKKPAGVP
jgi:hypothetical protein